MCECVFLSGLSSCKEEVQNRLYLAEKVQTHFRVGVYVCELSIAIYIISQILCRSIMKEVITFKGKNQLVKSET